MMDATKYAPGYYPVPAGYDSWVKKDHIEKAPAWCSVDLRCLLYTSDAADD